MIDMMNRECFLCGKKHRVSFPLDPDTVYWNEELDNYSFTTLLPSVYTRGMHKFDLARSQVVPACTCNCKSCEIARCREKNFWNVDCKCCRIGGLIDGFID